MSDTIEIVETFGPVHPGEILREEFIEPLGLTAGRVAKGCGIARTRIERIVAEEIGISGDTAIRLGRFFRTTPQFWMNLQQHYELEKAAALLGEAVTAIAPFEREAA
jgi:addiction module HigA family antidote